MFYTGIDPGKWGAIAILTSSDVHSISDMPLFDGWYDPTGIKGLLMLGEQIVCIEDHFRFPKVTKGVGIIWGISSTLYNVKRVEMIHPRVWQKFYHIKKADKAISLRIARQLFPDHADWLSRKKDHNRAEALLIANFIRRKYCPTSR